MLLHDQIKPYKQSNVFYIIHMMQNCIILHITQNKIYLYTTEYITNELLVNI